MWYKIKLLLLIIAFSLHVKAFSSGQPKWSSEIDSLKNQLNLVEDDTIKVNVYLKIAYKLIWNDVNLSIYFADSALQLSKKLNFIKGEGMAHSRLGLAYVFQENHTKAHEHSTLALAIHKKSNNIEWIANDLNALGIMYNGQADFKKSIDVFHHLLDVISGSDFPKIKGLALSNLGLSQFDFKQLDSAQHYYLQALIILNKANLIRETSFVLDNLADVYIKKKDYKNASKILDQAIEINQLEGNHIELGNNCIKLSKIYIHNEDFANAITLLDYTFNLALNYNLRGLKREVYSNYKIVYFTLNKFDEAYVYAEKESKLSDSLQTQALSERIEIVRKNYEFDNIQQSLLLSNQEIKSQERMIYVFILAAFLLLSFIYILLKFFKNKIRSNEALSQMNDEIKIQAIKIQQANEQILKMNENLEKLIEERTEALQVQNAKLIVYAHFNAHEIRGPIARLNGLLNLCKKYPDEIENQDFINRVFIAITELSEKVHEISGIFREDGSVDESKGS